jgi:F-box and WD-40 domain protein CDC4
MKGLATGHDEAGTAAAHLQPEEPRVKPARLQAVDPYATIGQLSIAPATHTTVVTTTKTTTTSYPPILMGAPRRLEERCSKEFPLAHVPTPESIRNITMRAGDVEVRFEEADDATQTIQEVRFVDLMSSAPSADGVYIHDN